MDFIPIDADRKNPPPATPTTANHRTVRRDEKPCYHSPLTFSRDDVMRLVFAIFALSLLLLSACSSTPSADISVVTQPPEQNKTETVVRPFPEDTFLDLLVAEFSMRHHDFDTALDHYAFQAEQTGDIGVISTASRLSQFLNRDELTLSLSQQWVAKAPDSVEAQFSLATILSKLEQPIAALPHMRRVLELGGESNFAALAASALSRPEGEQTQFFDELNRLAKSYPQESSIRVGQALLMQYRNEEEQALALIREVLASEPDNAHALLIETRTLSQLGRHEEARERLRHAVDQNPGNRRLRHDLARSLVSEKPYEALAQYQVLVQQNPKDEDLLLELMLVNRELDNQDEANEQLQTLENSDNNSSRVNYILGRIAEEDRKWPTALEHYGNAMGRPEYEFSSRRIAAISMGTEGNDEALQRLEKLRQRYPEHSVTYYLLSAEILRKADRFPDGFNLLSQALSAHPADNDLLYSRSLFAEALGKIDIVEQDLRAIIQAEPDNAAALNALGYTLANRTDRLDEAEALVKKALAIEPNDAAIIDSYGWILFQRGRTAEAITQLEQAFAKSEDHEIAAHLGEALWKAGQNERAQEVWQRGLKDTPNSTIIMDTLRRLELLNE